VLGSGAVVGFVPTRDLEAARTFYQGVLGLTLVEMTPIAVVLDANGTALRVTLVDELTPAPYTILGWQVRDVHATGRGLAARGVAFERFEGMGQDDDGVWTAPSGDQVAWFKDPEGNTLSVTQVVAG
jgi:catechol 2,3-dioxygenase-like lactoylglutathione lyase family enzyme